MDCSKSRCALAICSGKFGDRGTMLLAWSSQEAISASTSGQLTGFIPPENESISCWRNAPGPSWGVASGCGSTPQTRAMTCW